MPLNIVSITGADGRGVINILAADKLYNSPKLYSTFLLWMLAELFEQLPEVGGESGPGARPMHPQWARDLRDQCVAAGVPFFMKQLSGERGKTIKDISAFPLDLQVRKFPQ